MPEDTLFLVLAYKWYDMIDRGEKTEEYRRRCKRWDKMIWRKRDVLKRVVFQRGYGKGAPRMEFNIRCIGYANITHLDDIEVCGEHYKEFQLSRQWGYTGGSGCHIIQLGERIEP